MHDSYYYKLLCVYTIMHKSFIFSALFESSLFVMPTIHQLTICLGQKSKRIIQYVTEMLTMRIRHCYNSSEPLVISYLTNQPIFHSIVSICDHLLVREKISLCL